MIKSEMIELSLRVERYITMGAGCLVREEFSGMGLQPELVSKLSHALKNVNNLAPGVCLQDVCVVCN